MMLLSKSAPAGAFAMILIMTWTTATAQQQDRTGGTATAKPAAQSDANPAAQTKAKPTDQADAQAKTQSNAQAKTPAGAQPRPSTSATSRRPSLRELQARRLETSRRSFFAPRKSLSQLRFASVPDMFGDLILRGGQITASETLTGIPGPGVLTVADIPGPGGLRGTLVAENNRALPTDRLYFNYNQYRKPVHQTTLVDGAEPASYQNFSALHKYMFGFEKTLFDGHTSLEVRLPFFDSRNINIPATLASPHAHVVSDASEAGNLTFVLKHVVAESCTTVCSMGMAMELPTGSDSSLEVGGTRYEMKNDAVYLSPFIAVMYAPDETLFGHAFLQATTQTTGNTVRFIGLDGTGSQGDYGKYNDQTLVNLNLGFGRWLYKNRHADVVKGLALLGEIHYTGTVQSADTVSGLRDLPTLPPEVASFSITPRRSDMHVVNGVLGMQFQIRKAAFIRVAGVAPLTDSSNRFFDSELSLQLGRRF